jgi:hypothetical protein
VKQALEKSAPIIEHLRSWLGIGAVICAGVITPWEYIDVKQEKRVERTLTYVERYGDSGYADSAIKLDEAVDDRIVELARVLQNEDLSAREREEAYSVVIMGIYEDRELRTAMNSVLRFQEELVQCVLNNLCDRDVALNFFSNSTGDMLRAHYPYICDKRRKWNDPDAFRDIEQFYLGGSDRDICQNLS